MDARKKVLSKKNVENFLLFTWCVCFSLARTSIIGLFCTGDQEHPQSNHPNGQMVSYFEEDKKLEDRSSYRTP